MLECIGSCLELETEEPGCQAQRVKSSVSFTKTTSVCCCLLVIFLVAGSLEFPSEIFLATYARETLIKKWYTRGTDISEGVHSLGWQVKRKRVGGKLK
jgi:hypothetical protein